MLPLATQKKSHLIAAQLYDWGQEQIVPIERLHKIAKSQGPIARIFGLSTVEVTTAGGDVNIKFLTDEKADEISETLKKKINDMAVRERVRQ